MEGDTPVGFDVDLWKEVGVRMERETTLQNVPWDGLIPAIQADKCRAIISCMGITDEREEQMDFSIPYFKSLFGVVVQVDSDIQGLEDVDGKLLGAQTGTMAEGWARDNAADIGYAELVPYEEATDMLLDLQAGRIDAAINDAPFLNYSLGDKDDLRMLDLRIGSPILVGIAFREDDDELREDVNKALRDIVDDGTWASIYEEWFGAPPAPAEIP
jgi:polar amino acid transport system substrate-binding protein